MSNEMIQTWRVALNHMLSLKTTRNTGRKGRMMTVKHTAFSDTPCAYAADILNEYIESDHSVIAHETARVKLLKLIDGNAFTLNAYLLWCRRLNDVDAGRPITSAFIGNPNYHKI